MTDKAINILKTFPNPSLEKDFTVRMEIPEFTCLCPKTGQPDFALLEIEYVPDQLCLELKSLKLYICSYRNQGVFHEAVSNKILDDLVETSLPRFMRLKATFNIRGGIHTRVLIEHTKEGWSPPQAIKLP